jgi:hypothetical protein
MNERQDVQEGCGEMGNCDHSSRAIHYRLTIQHTFKNSRQASPDEIGDHAYTVLGADLVNALGLGIDPACLQAIQRGKVLRRTAESSHTSQSATLGQRNNEMQLGPIRESVRTGWMVSKIFFFGFN